MTDREKALLLLDQIETASSAKEQAFAESDRTSQDYYGAEIRHLKTLLIELIPSV